MATPGYTSHPNLRAYLGWHSFIITLIVWIAVLLSFRKKPYLFFKKRLSLFSYTRTSQPVRYKWVIDTPRYCSPHPLEQGSPTPRPRTGSSPRPVRSWAAQQEVSSGRGSEASSAAPHRPPCSPPPPTPPPAPHRWRYRLNHPPPPPRPWNNCLPRNQSLVPKKLGTAALEQLGRFWDSWHLEPVASDNKQPSPCTSRAPLKCYFLWMPWQEKSWDTLSYILRIPYLYHYYLYTSRNKGLEFIME